MPQQRLLFTLVLINFAAMTGFGLILPVLPLFVGEIGVSGAFVPWALGIYSLGQFVSAAMWGSLSDKWGRRPVFLATLLLSGVILFMTAFVQDPTLLLIMRFIGGIFGGSISIAYAVGSDISTPDSRTKVMGYIGAGFSLGFILGPAIGGIVGDMGAPSSAFARVCFAGAGLYVLTAVATFFILPETKKTEDEAQKKQKNDMELLRHAPFLLPLIIALTSMISIAISQTVFGLFTDNIYGFTPSQIGYLFAVMGVVSAVAQAKITPFAASKVGEQKLLVIALLVTSVSLLCINTSLPMVAVLIASISVQFGYALLTPVINSLASVAAPAGAQGAALGLIQSVSSLGRVIGPGLGGVLYSLIGPSSPFLIAGVLLVLVTLITIAWQMKARRETS